MTEIIAATHQNQFLSIEALADEIWRGHYIPIIGKPQVDYMLEKFQSVNAIIEQIEEGFEYFLLMHDEHPAGYFSVKIKESSLFLSKLYIKNDFRGKGLGKSAMQFIEEKARKYQLKSITLTVAKNNIASMKVYEKLGFENLGSVIIDIGSGYIMDDYKMEKHL